MLKRLRIIILSGYLLKTARDESKDPVGETLFRFAKLLAFRHYFEKVHLKKKIVPPFVCTFDRNTPSKWHFSVKLSPFHHFGTGPRMCNNRR